MLLTIPVLPKNPSNNSPNLEALPPSATWKRERRAPAGSINTSFETAAGYSAVKVAAMQPPKDRPIRLALRIQAGPGAPSTGAGTDGCHTSRPAGPRSRGRRGRIAAPESGADQEIEGGIEDETGGGESVDQHDRDAVSSPPT